MNQKCTSDMAFRHENSIPERIYTCLPAKYVVPDILLQHLKLCEADDTFYKMARRMIVERKKFEEIDCDGIPGNVGTAYREEYVPCFLSKKKMSRYMDYAILQCGVDPHLPTGF